VLEFSDGMANALWYHRKPEHIANRAYCNRMGNGDEASGDGWAHRGFGLIQLTGTENQTMYANDVGDLSLIEHPEKIAEPYHAAISACWFFGEFKHLNELSDPGTPEALRRVTFRVNGGYNGLPDRESIWGQAMKVL